MSGETGGAQARVRISLCMHALLTVGSLSELLGLSIWTTQSHLISQPLFQKKAPEHKNCTEFIMRTCNVR